MVINTSTIATFTRLTSAACMLGIQHSQGPSIMISCSCEDLRTSVEQTLITSSQSRKVLPLPSQLKHTPHDLFCRLCSGRSPAAAVIMTTLTLLLTTRSACCRATFSRGPSYGTASNAAHDEWSTHATLHAPLHARPRLPHGLPSWRRDAHAAWHGTSCPVALPWLQPSSRSPLGSPVSISSLPECLWASICFVTICAPDTSSLLSGLASIQESLPSCIQLATELSRSNPLACTA